MASSTWKPLITVVVTSSEKVSAKAGEWVQAQTAERPHDLIMVIQDLHPQLLVAHLLNMFGGLLGSPGFTADDVAPMSAPPGLEVLAFEPTETRRAAPDWPFVDLRKATGSALSALRPAL